MTALPAQLPWFMKDWLRLDGLVRQPYLLPFAALAALLAAAWRWRPRDTVWRVPAAIVILAAPALAVTFVADRACPDCEYLAVESPYIRSDLAAGWQWMSDHVTGSTVAYTGINLPYPLTGRDLSNRVIYVNIDGRPRWRFDDYDRAFRAGRFRPEPPPLAHSSGELMPVAATGGPVDALRPRYERMEGFRDGWIDNLRRLDVHCIFIASLSAYEIDYQWHDEFGFPIEEDWAERDPARFHLLYHNSLVRVFAVDNPIARSGA